MRITWVTRSFLDYRIPVFAALDELCGHQLTVIYNGEVVPERCTTRLRGILGERCVAMMGEKRVTGQNNAPISTSKRKGVRIPLQPGLVKACKASHPDVMISDGFFQWTYAALWMRMIHRVRHVMCYEPTKHTERNAQWFRTVYRRLASHWIDAICCNGQLCKEYCQDVLHISEAKISTGQMAADSEQLALNCQKITDAEVEAFKKQNDIRGTVFLFVGRLVELKGVQHLLDSWKGANLKNATFLCAGDGPLLEGLKSFCNDNGIHAFFAGNIDYDHIAIFYRCADIFVIPTLQDNWSLVVPEAMACGLPIACSKYNGCYPELVHAENGWVFDPLDAKDTVAMLQTAAQQTPEQLKAMGEAGRRIVQDFSPANAAKAIYECCEKAIKR